MSSRNPMNERYTIESKKGGKTRKSAASAKPKMGAASSVIQGTKKKKSPVTPTNKREKKREERNKAYEAERKYGDPPTKKFKRIRKIWVGFLIASIVMVALSFATSRIENMPEWFPMAFLIAAYACIIVTLYLDLGKIRKMRREYAAQMSSMQTKESRAEQKKLKAAQRQAEKEAELRHLEEEKRKSELKEARANMSFLEKIKSYINIKKPKK